jgi:hypothetical protein
MLLILFALTASSNVSIMLYFSNGRRKKKISNLVLLLRVISAQTQHGHVRACALSVLCLYSCIVQCHVNFAVTPLLSSRRLGEPCSKNGYDYRCICSIEWNNQHTGVDEHLLCTANHNTWFIFGFLCTFPVLLSLCTSSLLRSFWMSAALIDPHVI